MRSLAISLTAYLYAVAKFSTVLSNAPVKTCSSTSQHRIVDLASGLSGSTPLLWENEKYICDLYKSRLSRVVYYYYYGVSSIGLHAGGRNDTRLLRCYVRSESEARAALARPRADETGARHSRDARVTERTKLPG